ncbi:hypothetical protein KZ820_06700 [Sphingomonas sp. RRHST34]|uniref:PRC-barrel domain-containing protein n=1 Tax=Sphingomonas citri TaxID=2862499 RepID=A0ABS7BLW5_9SPHN|nr:hypothetical protein [Sphingomonas citri]
MFSRAYLISFVASATLTGAAMAQSSTPQPLPPLPSTSSGSYEPNPWSYAGLASKPRFLPASQATASDIVVGATVNSIYGPPIGTVTYVTDSEAVVRTAHSEARVPLKAFGKSQRGLLLEISPWKLDQLAASAQRGGS